MKIFEPRTNDDFEKYYNLRWKILRKPWNQLIGSEKDELENESVHLMVSDNKNIIGVGRLHFNSKNEAQIRYMAVEEDYQKKGVGKLLLNELKKKAIEKGAKHIVLNARESAILFYKEQGFLIVEKSHTLFGSVPHFKMEINLK